MNGNGLVVGLALAAAAGAGLCLSGCGTVGYGYTDVYGGYGYVGPWNYAPFEPHRSDIFVRPPFSGGAPAHPTPARGGRPAGPPSIPNRPRPSPGGGSPGGGPRGGGSGGRGRR